MKPIDQNKRDRDTDPSNVQQTPDHKSRPDAKRITDQEDDTSSTYVDLDKGNFADRPHGRTNDSLGPDHEPGTV